MLLRRRPAFQREERDDPGQFLQRDWLLDVVLEPGAQDTGAVFWTGEAGEGGRGHRATLLRRQGANRPDEPIAALVGQVRAAQPRWSPMSALLVIRLALPRPAVSQPDVR